MTITAVIIGDTMNDHLHQGGEEFDLRIVAGADDFAPPIIRLRHVLKGLLRAHNFRVVSCRDVTAYPGGQPRPADDEEAGGCRKRAGA
jgi:hypothetical protein